MRKEFNQFWKENIRSQGQQKKLLKTKIMSQQTALEWFIENIPIRYRNAFLNDCKEELEKAKEMQETQIKNSWHDGNLVGRNGWIISSAHEYYNETYNK